MKQDRVATFSERLKQALHRNGMKQIDLVNATGIDRAAISNYLADKYEPKQIAINKMASVLGVSEMWLWGYDVPMNPEYQSEKLLKYPIIGSITAGYNGEAVETYDEEYEILPSTILNGHNPDDFFVLRVKGSSMYPKFLDGDRVLVQRVTSVDSGSIAVVLYGNTEATLKRVRYVYGEDWLELIPENPEYQTKRVENTDLEQCRVLGKVVKLIRDI